MRARLRFLIAPAILLLGLTACFGSREPVPAALARYLEALTDGDLETAYRITQLDDLRDAQGRGAAITREHFVAFYEANPVSAYTVAAVTRLTRIPTGTTPVEQGTPFFETEVELTFADGVRRSVLTVEGEVLGVVMVEPELLRIQVPGADLASIEVDGVATDVTMAKLNVIEDAWQILVIPGPHRITAGGATVTIASDPLRVISGPASVADDVLIVRT